MNAPATVLGVGHLFNDERHLRFAAASQNPNPSRNNGHRTLAIERLLKQTGLTMVALSSQTRMRFGEDSPFFIPKTFLYKQRAGITPHICQLVALSEISGYRFTDCMTICGFDLKLISELQLNIPNERTTMLVGGHTFSSIGRCFEETNFAEHQQLNRYCYAKIGRRDAVAYPAVRPGSIVRADRCYPQELLNQCCSDENLWLVEHPTGLTCCRVKSVGKSEVVLFPDRPPLSPWPLRLSTQARILGLVDSQLFPDHKEYFASLPGVTEPNPTALPSKFEARMTVSRLLRAWRLRTGLTFREAHKMTLQIAARQQNRDFRISVSLLSDYEAMNKLPRHIAKFITLCVIYGIDPWELLRAAGIQLRESAKRAVFSHEALVDRNDDRLSNSWDQPGLPSKGPKSTEVSNASYRMGA